MSIEDPGCLSSIGIFPETYTAAPTISRAPMRPSFEAVRVNRPVAEDPGCLSSLNVVIDLPAAPAAFASTGATNFMAAATPSWSIEQTDAFARLILDQIAHEDDAKVAAPPRALAMA